MADEPNFKITIPNLQNIIDAFSKAPEIAEPILQAAIYKTTAILAQFTRPNTPYRTGNLVNTFQGSFGKLVSYWGPTADYAADVEFGTRAHEIWPVKKKALFWPGAAHPVRMVKHPGTKGKPFMERIKEAAHPGITELFNNALENLADQIAERSNQ